jgi:hypothetical protein
MCAVSAPTPAHTVNTAGYTFDTQNIFPIKYKEFGKSHMGKMKRKYEAILITKNVSASVFLDAPLRLQQLSLIP